MKVPTRTQIAVAVAEFMKSSRFLSDEEWRDARLLADPIAAALRAAEKFRPAVVQDQEEIDRATGKMRFRVEAWMTDESEIEEVVAACTNLSVAEAAYKATLAVRPTSLVVLRDGGRTLDKRIAMMPVYATRPAGA